MDSSAKINWQSEQSHVLLNPRLPAAEAERLQELERKFPQSGHIWIASSGSSATANQSVKWIALSKRAFLASAEAVNRHVRATPQDVWVQVLPRFHVGGLSIETRAQLSGSSVVPGWENEKWNPEFFVQAIEKNRGSLTAMVPTQVFDLIQRGLRAPSSLRAVIIGGSALGTEVYSQATDLGWPLLPSYGLTECCSQVATAPLDSWRKKDSSFQILSHIEARTNAEGLLQIRAPSLLTGYAQWVDGQALWKDPKVDGWYQTEDFCEIKNGILKPLGRGSDYVKVSGEGVNLLKLQEILETVAQRISPEFWKQMALAAIPDPRTGSALILAIADRVSETVALEVQKQFNQQVAPFERITKAQRTREIPRTDLGKIARAKLKATLISENP